MNLSSTLISLLVITCLIIGGIAYGLARLTGSREIISDKPIKPIKRLVTDGKTVDTLYVYPIKP